MGNVLFTLEFMKKAIITGANGFAGSWLTLELLSNGYEVIGLDRSLSDNQNDFIHWFSDPDLSFDKVQYLQNDLSDQKQIENILNEISAGVIFHLAGSAFVPDSWRYPLETLENNTTCTIRILEAAKISGWKGRFVYISSAEVYGSVSENELPITEKTAVTVDNPYALSKWTAEQFGMYYRSDTIDFIVARPFNHTGPGQRNNFAIPAFVQRVLNAEMNNRDSIIVGDLDSVRDFSDVRDVAYAYRTIAEKGIDGEVYNICSGNPVKIKDLLTMITNLSKKKIGFEVDQTLLRPEGSNERYGDPGKLQSLGWNSEIKLKTTILDMWEQEQKSLIKHSG